MSDLFLFLLTIICLCNLGATLFFFFKIKELKTAVLMVHKRIDSIFTVDPVDKPAANEATKEDPNTVELTENESVPDKLKFEVEGGDSQVPQGFETTA